MLFLLRHLCFAAFIVACGGALLSHLHPREAAVGPLPPLSVAQRQASSSSNQTSFAHSNTPFVKSFNPALSAAIAACTIATYAFLISSSERLLEAFALPRSSIERRISTLLATFWIFHVGLKLVLEPILIDGSPQIYVAYLCRDSVQGASTTASRFCLVGHQDMAVEEPEEPLHKRGRDDIHVRFAPASYVMKNITQTAIWQVWILWVTASMVALTVTYNGFIYHEPGPDAWFRLGLVMAYATFNVLHACLALRCFKQILDSIGNQACWSLISRIWIFIDRAGAIHEQGTGNKLHVLKQFTCQLLGYTSIETMYKSIPNRRRPKEEAANANERTSQESIDAGLAAGQYLVEEDKTLMASAQEAEKTVKTFIDGEVKSFEKSAESALEKTIVNVAVMLGVCLSTGLAPLTTVRSGDSTAAQLGSYALLLALGTGTAALAASLSHLANARDAANMLLRLQSHMLTLPYDGRSVDARRNTVTMDRDGESPMVRWMDLFFCIRGWRCVLAPFLGPALGLVPLSERRSSAMQDRGYWGEVGQDLRFKVFGSTLEASTRTREVIKKTGMSLRAKVPQRPADAQRPEPAAAEDGTGGIELAEVSSLIR